jgi:outer membrane protein assembly factor BamB
VHITVLAIVLMLVAVSWTAAAGESRVITINDHFRSYRYQPRAGDLDIYDPDRQPVWSNKEENITTGVFAQDLDDSGINELVFGTDRGRLFAIQLGTWEDVLKEEITSAELHAIAIGNLDDDEEPEVVITAADGIYCFDMSNEKVIWSRDYENFYSQVMLVPVRTEPGELDRSEVLVLRAKGTSLAGTEFFLMRFDGEGHELYKTILTGLEGPHALRPSWVVQDLDRDSDLDVFVSDRGNAAIGASGPGRNIWLVEASNGTISGTWTIRHATLASRPLLVVSDGYKFVAIGMNAGMGTADANDLLLFEGSERSFQYMDIYDNSEIVSWQYLNYIPDGASGTMVLSSSNWNMHAFHLGNKNVSWTKQFTGAGLSTNPVACDIDDDGEVELICPGGGLTFINVITGEVEGRIDVEKGTAISIVLTVGDIDDDDVSETVFGHYDSESRRVYDLSVYGQVAYEEPEHASSFWGWVLVLAIVGANIVLIIDLWRKWEHRGEDEEE